MSKQFLGEIHLPAPGKMSIWAGLPGSSKSLAITQAKAVTHSNILVICVNDAEAEKVYDEICFFSGDDKDSVFYFPETETLPYDLESPHSGLVSKRARLLYDLATSSKQLTIVVSIKSLMQRIASKNYWATKFVRFAVGSPIVFSSFNEEMKDMGYEKEDLEVNNPGQFVVRNNVIDIYPIGEKSAFRVRTKNGVIEEIMSLDINSQRSIAHANSFLAQPAREMPIDSYSISLFRQKYRSYFNGGINDSVYVDVSNGVFPPGIETYAPFFQEEMVSLFDYLPDGNQTNVFLLGNVIKSASLYLEQINDRYKDLQTDPHRKIISPELIWLSDSDIKTKLSQYAVIMTAESQNITSSINFMGVKTDITRQPDLQSTIEILQKWVSQEKKVVFSLHSQARAEEIDILCQLIGLSVESCDSWNDFLSKDNNKPVVLISKIDEGFYLEEQKILVITEKEIFDQPIFSKNEENQSAINYDSIQDLQNLCIGDPIVHAKYGVGRFNGLSTMNISDIEREYLTIKYAHDAIAYVKMEDLDLVTMYSGLGNDKAPLDEMNSEKWMNELDLVIKNIRDVAGSLIKIKKTRAKRKGLTFNAPDYSFYKFCKEFPFQETKDQKLATNDIIKDMTSSRPMDRLVCGDVGFGKTEIAMRAAFLAANSGYQVAIMVPTTLLANQHFENFKKRFSSFNFNIECLTRYDKTNEKTVLDNIANGSINIVIGTHRLIQSDVRFNNIGLMIIDEEHRFGVNHKEKIKSIRKNIDVLSLTATPIPRTMSMTMHGIREISIIATPPAKRLSIRTVVKKEDISLTREAIQREIMRNGQVFYLHNRVETINQKAELISSLIPGLRVAVAHAKMNELELESVMRDFYAHKYDVLVCTTIIETGIDIPRANTIIIDQANKLGLAQLHQLRGRVGRSHHQAYAYLFTDNEKVSDNATKRLEAMAKATNLGDGFILANHDLEIRGAGELLGEEQSGQMFKIGFSLYMRLLEKAIDFINNGHDFSDFSDFSDFDDEMNIDIQISGLIDKSYITNERARLSIYKRFASINDLEGLNALKEELEDSYGELPANAENLLNIARLRCYLKKIDVVKLNVNKDEGIITLRKRQSARIERLIDLAESNPSVFQLTSPYSLRFTKKTDTIQERFTFLLWLVSKITSKR